MGFSKLIVVCIVLSWCCLTVLCQFLQQPGRTVEVTRGGNVTLTCQFDPSRLNLQQARLYWYAHSSGLLIDSQLNSPRYRLNANINTGLYDLTILSANYTRDDQNFSCRAQIGSNVRMSQPIKVTVLTPPGIPVVTISPDSSTFREGDPVTLRCETRGGSPPPAVIWYDPNGVSVDGEYRPGDVQHPTVKVITIQASRQDHQKDYTCEVYNKVNKLNKLSVTRQLNIRYQPHVLVIPNKDPLKLEQGTQTSIRCEVDANPAVTYVRWFKDGVELSSKAYEFVFNPVTEDHTGVYRCEARNNLGQGRDEITIVTLHAPRLTTPPKLESNEFGDISVTCDIDANPLPTVAGWWKGQRQISGSATLRLNRVTRQDGGNYTCKVTNVLDLSLEDQPQTRTQESVTFVQINYAPGPASVEPVPPVNTGESAVLMCSVTDYGVPRGDFEWRRKGETTVIWRGANYQPGQLGLSDNGVYECLVRNSIGAGTPGAVTLVVNQAPELIAYPPNNIHHNESHTGLFVTCGARGKPTPSIEWYKNGERLSDSTDFYKIVSNTTQVNVYISEATSTLWWRGPHRKSFNDQNHDDALLRSDNGFYECRAVGSGREASHTLRLAVNYAPVVASNRTKFAYNIGDQASLLCTTNSMPEPTYIWFKQSSGQQITENERFSLETFISDGTEKSESQLVINDVKAEDLGEYRCVASNMIGQGSGTITLQRKSVPDPPVGLEALQVTYESVMLRWTPGFDGGEEQDFLLRYIDGGQETTIQVQPPTASEFNLTGLQQAREYTFTVQAINSLGVSKTSSSLIVGTEPKPFNADDVTLTSVGISEVSKRLSWSAPDSEGNLCVKVEEKDENDNWKVIGPCVPVSEGGVKLEDYSPGMQVRASVCIPHKGSCGSPKVAEISFYMKVLIIIIVVVIVVVIVIATIIICCCCRKRTGKKASRKDYEMESSHVRAPNTYATPPRYQDGIVNKGMNGSPVEYGDPRKDAPYSITNGYGNSSTYYQSGYGGGPPPAYNGGSTASDIYKPDPWDAQPLFNDNDLNRLNNGQLENPYLHISGLPNPYDYDDYTSQAPSTNVTYDNGSMAESGYSTPNHSQRKVIHEVIV